MDATSSCNTAPREGVRFDETRRLAYDDRNIAEPKTKLLRTGGRIVAGGGIVALLISFAALSGAHAVENGFKPSEPSDQRHLSSCPEALGSGAGDADYRGCQADYRGCQARGRGCQTCGARC